MAKAIKSLMLDECVSCRNTGADKYHCDECGTDFCDICNSGSGCCTVCGVAIDNDTEDSVSAA